MDHAHTTITAIHRTVALLQQAQEPRVISRMKSGWAVLCPEQVVPGYAMLLPDPVVGQLNDLRGSSREEYLADMAMLGDAILAATKCRRINYEILGNLEPALHAHVIPRYADEPERFRTAPIWFYDFAVAPKFDPAVHGELRQAIARHLGALLA